jgi:hypothetical protein
MHSPTRIGVNEGTFSVGNSAIRELGILQLQIKAMN